MDPAAEFIELGSDDPEEVDRGRCHFLLPDGTLEHPWHSRLMTDFRLPCR